MMRRFPRRNGPDNACARAEPVRTGAGWHYNGDLTMATFYARTFNFKDSLNLRHHRTSMGKWPMKKFRATLIVLALIFAIPAGTAGAAGPGSFTCLGGSSSAMSTIPAGTYAQVTVTGVCHILGAVTGPAVGPNGTEVI